MPREYRINKFIAECTGCSRRDAEELVLAGKVIVNGKKLDDLSRKITDKDKVILNGKKLAPSYYSYVLLNKPPGYITTRDDEKNRKTILDLLPDKLHRLKPVGRLDKDSSGLVILTDDGELINLLTHPRYEIPKIYKVMIKGNFTCDDIDKFHSGIDIGEKLPAFAEVKSIVLKEKNVSDVTVVLKQGYNRQIRKMMEKTGHDVLALKRLAIGPVNLKSLKKGQFTFMTKKEVDNLLNYVESRV